MSDAKIALLGIGIIGIVVVDLLVAFCVYMGSGRDVPGAFGATVFLVDAGLYYGATVRDCRRSRDIWLRRSAAHWAVPPVFAWRVWYAWRIDGAGNRLLRMLDEIDGGKK